VPRDVDIAGNKAHCIALLDARKPTKGSSMTGKFLFTLWPGSAAHRLVVGAAAGTSGLPRARSKILSTMRIVQTPRASDFRN